MKIGLKIKLSGETFIALSMYLLVFYLCLPISMTVLNSLLIYIIVFLSAILFISGLVWLGRLDYLFSFLSIFLFMFLFWRITWSVRLEGASYLYYCFASLSFVFGGMVLHKSKNKELVKHLFYYLTIIYLITSITSIFGLMKYPLAAREMARGSTYDTSLDFTIYKNMYRRMNIVSWSQVYGMLFSIPTALMLWKKKKNIFFICLIVLVTMMLVASQITYAVILGIAFIVAGYITQGKSMKKVLISIALAVLIIIFVLFMEPILAFAVDVSEKAGLDFLTTKLNDLKVLLVNKNAVGDAASRNELYQVSIKTFIANPIFGLLFVGKANLNLIGYHSELFDLLGTFGMLGMIVIILAVVGYSRYLRKEKRECRKDLFICFLGFIALFVVNPVFNSPQVFVGAFLYPLLASRYCMETNNLINEL